MSDKTISYLANFCMERFARESAGKNQQAGAISKAQK